MGENVLFRESIGHTSEIHQKFPEDEANQKEFCRAQLLRRRTEELEALSSHELSQSLFGLTPIGTGVTNDGFRENQLLGLQRIIKSKQRSRIYYTNLFATVIFFCLYVLVIFLQRSNVHQQSMLLKSFMISLLKDLPADSQGFTSSGLGTSGFLSSPQEFLDWLNNSIIQTIFSDDMCGDGLCRSAEYAGVGRFGCESDCGVLPNHTEIKVELSSFMKSRPLINANKWDLSGIRPVGDPAFRFNIFSESMQDYIFEKDQTEEDVAMTTVLDGVYYLELYQTQKVSTVVPKEDFFTNSFIQARTVGQREAQTDFAYGDYLEFLAVSASMVDAMVDHCFGPDTPLTPKGTPDTECDHFFQLSFFVRAFSGYGLGGSVVRRDGNKAVVSLVDVPRCGVFPNGSMGLGGMRRYSRGMDVGMEWDNTGSEWNIPIMQAAGDQCEDGLDISGIVNLYGALHEREVKWSLDSAQTKRRSAGLQAGEQSSGPSPKRRRHAAGHRGGQRQEVRANSAVDRPLINVSVSGPSAADGGAGFQSGVFWAVVTITTAAWESASEVRYSLSDSESSCANGTRYTRPVLVSGGGWGSKIRAAVCQGALEIAFAEASMPVYVPGPELRFEIAVSAELPTSALTALKQMVCRALGVEEFCTERVRLEAGKGVGTEGVAVLSESHAEAAAWRKLLLKNSSLLSSAPTGVGVACCSPLAGVRVHVPVDSSLLRTIGQPCTSHYDCVGEATGTKVVDGATVVERGWGRAFCALWGSPFTDGAGPTCDHCRLYCASAPLSSVDGVCPEDCGTPWAGNLPMCLSAEALRRTYRCSSRHRFEVRQHSEPNQTIPSPRRGLVPRRRDLSGNNVILGAVVLTQRRVARAECPNGGSARLSSFTSAYGVNCSGGRHLSGRPFGIDPTFSPFSQLFNGKHVATDYYKGQRTEMPNSAAEEAFAGAEGFWGTEGSFIPFGFFPHQWDTVLRRPKNRSHVVSGAEGEFKLFFDVRLGAEQAARLLTFIKDGRFFDDATDALEIEVATYNAESNMFASVLLLFKVQGTGGISWDYSMRTVDAVIDTSPLQQALEVLVILCLAVNVLVELRDIVRDFLGLRLSKYITSAFNWIDLLGFIVQIMAWVQWYTIKSAVSSLQLREGGIYSVLLDPHSRIRPFQTDAAEEADLLRFMSELARVADLHLYYTSLIGAVVAQLLFKVLKALDFHPRMGLITRTIARAGSNLAHFMGLFMLLVFGYAMVGHVTFGAHLAGMSTLTDALRTLGYALLNFDSTQFHSQMVHAVRREDDAVQANSAPMYDIYIWTFIFMYVFILLNVLLAILVTAYTEIRASANDSQSLVQDIWEYVSYYARKLVLPVERFVSDEQLLAHVAKELHSLEHSKSIRDGCSGDSSAAGNEQDAIRSLRLQKQAEISSDALTPHRTILLGSGLSMGRRQLRKLIQPLLDQQVSLQSGNRRRHPTSAVVVPEIQTQVASYGNGAEVQDPSRQLKKCSTSRSMTIKARQAVQSNYLVEDLLHRHGVELDCRSAAIVETSRKLLELEGQSRLLRMEEQMAQIVRLLSRDAAAAPVDVDVCCNIPSFSPARIQENNLISSVSLSEETSAPCARRCNVESCNGYVYPAVVAGTLHVWVKRARNLPRMDFLHSGDPYCVLFVVGADGATAQHTVTSTLSGRAPKWDEQFRFDISPGTQRLVVSVWDEDQLSADDLVGSTSLELRDLVPEVLEDDWFPLQNPALGRKVSRSALRLQVVYIPLTVGEAATRSLFTSPAAFAVDNGIGVQDDVQADPINEPQDPGERAELLGRELLQSSVADEAAFQLEGKLRMHAVVEWPRGSP